MRKLATLRKVEEVKPIENADAIEHVRVDGWWIVCKKGDFQKGDLALYLEIDSWVPHELAPFLSKGKEPKEYNGVKGEKLRTVRLRGALSQGLLLNPQNLGLDLEFDKDFSEELNIQKWEPPCSATLRGLVKGSFPSFIPKTEQERIQNLPRVFDDLTIEYEATYKLDGSSCTVYCNKGEVGVCSRNLDLKLEDEDNTFVKTASKCNWLDVVKNFYADTGRSIALQGELMGPGVQGNREQLKEHQLFLFDIWDIDNQCYFPSSARLRFIDYYDLEHVPVENISILSMFGNSIEMLLKYVEDVVPYPLTDPIEGLVFKQTDGKFSFKVINNKFLEGKR